MAAMRPLSVRPWVWLWLGLLGLGCAPVVDLGACDEVAARTVAYREDGTPAYAGQALVLTACAGCHASTAADRMGAPPGTDYDVEVVGAEAEALPRLAAAQRTVHAHRGAIYATVLDGSMPPAGSPPGPSYELADGTPLALDERGRELLRNWLACRVPVVERTLPHATYTFCAVDEDCDSRLCSGDGTCAPVGDVVAARAPRP